MKRKPMTAYQVLHAWLETQIGAAANYRPKGYEMPGEHSSAWPETRARAAALVEGLPMYEIFRPHMIEHLQGHRNDLCDYIEGELESFLRSNPFYPSFADGEDVPRTPVIWWNVEQVAEYLNVQKQTVRDMVCKGKFKYTISYRRRLTILSDEVENYKKLKKG